MTEIPSLLYSEIEDDVRATLRGLLADRCSWNDVLTRVDTDEPYDDALWKAVGEDLGLAGLLVPEELGGAGGTAREVAVVLEELARAVAPVPYLASAVLAVGALLAAPEGPARDGALGALAAGAKVGTLAVPATTYGAPFPLTVTGAPDGDGLVLTGAVTSVLAADRADLLVVPVVVAGEPYLALVDGTAPGLTRGRITTLDATRPVGPVTLDGVPAAVVAGPDAAEAALRHALGLGAALLASEQLGVSERALEEAVNYLKVRHQFGRPIGSYQALRHRAADLWADIAAARATARYAAAAFADGSPDAEVAASLAQAYCGDVAVHAAEECVQMHGGIGFTWEHPAHLYLKRAMSLSLLLGTADRHRTVLGGLVDLPPA
ncbi:acyl-CoA dehydrogenase family protein [Yinghuangia seranimata]|uniref:acyl-CoA dehydrogenase family protein n=1 Tax=Yinghuangia seranimata TaxID=408067 RepID=UPI00248B9DE5|nr:acyl-CoA dehydrogenase family protein [Yinghuangia seranimata]MDI2131592.1 acyl-CoA dehydrogenase family protein [Yinghuangia seranimata]